MSGLPALAGAVQETVRLVVFPAIAKTVGVAGASGGSSTSVTLMVTVATAVAVASEAVTRDRVGGLGLVVVADAGLGADLPGGPDKVEGGHVVASQHVGEGIVVGVGGRYRGADILARGGVLRDGTGQRSRN